MIKIGQIFAGNSRNFLKEKTQLSFASQILIRPKALEATRNSNPTRSSSIAITNVSYTTKLSSTHYLTNLNKSTDARNSSSILLVDKARQNYSKEEDEKLLEHINKYGKSSSSLKSFSKDFGRSFGSISRRIYRLESGNEYDTNYEPRAWEFEEDEKLVNYVFKLKSIKSANISSFKNASLKDFEEIAKEFKKAHVLSTLIGI